MTAPTPFPGIDRQVRRPDGCGGCPARTWVSTNVTFANCDLDQRLTWSGTGSGIPPSTQNIGRPELALEDPAHRPASIPRPPTTTARQLAATLDT